jgi:transcriptional regulator with XRE-family HTH domain
MTTKTRTPVEAAKSDSYMRLVQRRVRELREEAKISQKELALAMTTFGFNWNEATCTQVERGRRAVSLEELVALAAIWGRPVTTFLSAASDETLALPGGRFLTPDVLRELLVGEGGIIGEGGPFWRTAREVLLSGAGAEALVAKVFTESTLFAEKLAYERGELEDVMSATTNERARQAGFIETHVPPDELPDELMTTFRTAGDGARRLVLVRPSDGAQYAINEKGQPGVLRLTVEDGREILTTFVNGRMVDRREGGAPPWLAELN